MSEMLYSKQALYSTHSKLSFTPTRILIKNIMYQQKDRLTSH